MELIKCIKNKYINNDKRIKFILTTNKVNKNLVFYICVFVIFLNTNSLCIKLNLNKEQAKISLEKKELNEKKDEIDPFQEISNENYKVSEHITKYFRNINHLDEDGHVLKENTTTSSNSEKEEKFDGSDNELESIQAEVQKSGVYTFEKLIDILKNKPQLILSKIKTPSPNDTFEFPRFNSVIDNSILTKFKNTQINKVTNNVHFFDFNENDIISDNKNEDQVTKNGIESNDNEDILNKAGKNDYIVNKDEFKKDIFDNDLSNNDEINLDERISSNEIKSSYSPEIISNNTNEIDGPINLD